MLTISFKNVGQGDSIILEWKDGDKDKVGIIDSHIYKNRNPVLEFLRARVPPEIEFIFLSHGHYDHFSGLSDVLDYCFSKNIVIKNFYHTLSGRIIHVFSKENRAAKSIAAETLINNLEKYSNGKDKIIIEKNRAESGKSDIKLNDQIVLSILSPTDNDFTALEIAIGKHMGNKISTEPNINKVSTILQLTKDDEYILLTSDATRPQISRIECILFKKKMIIGQVPHHGSNYNHRSKFWKNATRNENCKAVFSCGFETKDKLPDYVPVKEIHDLKYKIHSTNQVYGIKDVFGSNPLLSDEEEILSDLTDLFVINTDYSSTPSIDDDLNGDQRFVVWD